MPDQTTVSFSNYIFLYNAAIEGAQYRLNAIRLQAGVLELAHERLLQARQKKSAPPPDNGGGRAAACENAIANSQRQIDNIERSIQTLPEIEAMIRRIIYLGKQYFGPEYKIFDEGPEEFYKNQIFIIGLWIDYNRICVRALQFRFEHNNQDYRGLPNEPDAKLLSAQRMMLAAKVSSWKDAPAELAGKEVFSPEWWKILGC